jgi:hypothetical protein
MLVFNADKEKDFTMMIETSNINDDQLEFMFIIDINDVQYGFKCDMTENKVKIHIPILNEIINNLKADEYKAFLQVTGNNNYLLKPFNEQIKIISKPKIDVLLSKDNENDLKEELKVTISKIIDDKKNKIKEDIKEDTKGVKSKMSQFLQ